MCVTNGRYNDLAISLQSPVFIEGALNHSSLNTGAEVKSVRQGAFALVTI